MADRPRRLSDFEISEMPILTDDDAMLVEDNQNLRAELRRLEGENHQLRIAANEHELFLRGLESDEEPNELDHSWPHRT